MSCIGVTPVYYVDDAGEKELAALMEVYGDVIGLDERARTGSLTYDADVARGRMHDIIDARAVGHGDADADAPIVPIEVEEF